MSAASERKIAWILPTPSKGSGGYRTILQNIKALEDSGCQCSIYLMPTIPVDIDNARCDIKEWFGYDFERIELVSEISDAYDAVVATFWMTAYAAYVAPISKKIYFCQDYEPYFYPIGDDYFEAERSYRLGLRPLCLGRWLASKVSASSGTLASSYDFGADQNVYFPSKGNREYAVCAIFQPEKSRRMSRLLVDAVRILNQLDPRLTIYVYGSEGNTKLLDGLDVCNLGIITTEECNALYNVCLAGISLSSTNPSRIPFEMMSAGLPVIELDLPNNREDMPDSAIRFAQCDPEHLAHAVLKTIGSEDELKMMSAAGVRYMSGRDIRQENQSFLNAFRDAMDVRESCKTIDVLRTESDVDKAYIAKRISSLCESKVCFRCRRVSLRLFNLPPRTEGVVVYIWSRLGQDDMKSSEFRSDCVEGMALGCSLPDGIREPTLCNIHAYALIDGEAKLLFMLQHSFVTTDEKSAGRMVTLDLDGVVCKMEAL